MNKRVIIGLIVISAALIMASGVSANVCVFKVGGTCVFWSGSVIGDISANGLGNIKKDPKAVRFTVQSTEPDEDGQTALTQEESPPLTGWVFCGNPSQYHHAAPGRQPADFSGEYPMGFSYITEKDLDKNGTSDTVVKAKLDEAALAAAYELNAVCEEQNHQWVAIDFVPFKFYTVVDLEEVADDGSIVYIDNAAFYCELPDPNLVVWDKKTNAPTQEQYDCDRLW